MIGVLVRLLFVSMCIHSLHPIALEEMQKKIIGMSSAFIGSRAIQVMAELGIADHLNQEPQSLEPIAIKMGLQLEPFYRLMRMLASHEIVQQHDNQKFSLTDMGLLLQTNAPGSLRTLLMHEDEPRWVALTHLKETLISGKPAFDSLFGMSYYEFLACNKEAGIRFDNAMKILSTPESNELINKYTFEKNSLVIDIGGGEGELVLSLLHAFPTLRGIVFDMPSVVEKCDSAKFPELKNRIQFYGGDFFKAFPKDGDFYIFKRVLHNWTDEHVVKILKKCTEVLKPHAKIVIIEGVIASPNVPDALKNWDIFGMTLMPGKERTKDEWEHICAKAGLRITTIIPTQTWLSIIEVMKR